MKNEYSKNQFLSMFLKEISLISYDYTNQFNVKSKKIHLLVNLDDKCIYPIIASITTSLLNDKKIELF